MVWRGVMSVSCAILGTQNSILWLDLKSLPGLTGCFMTIWAFSIPLDVARCARIPNQCIPNHCREAGGYCFCWTHSPIQHKSLCSNAVVQVQVILSPCPAVSPCSCKGSTQSCATDVAGPSRQDSILVDHNQEGHGNWVHAAAANFFILTFPSQPQSTHLPARAFLSLASPLCPRRS